jgi:hypothetical protein
MTTHDDYAARYALYRKAAGEATTFNKTALFDALSEAGITILTVTFDGEGDSGQIQDIAACHDAEAREVPDIQLEILEASWSTGKLDGHKTTLRDAIERLCFDLLSQEHEGWENNDGAFGELTFDVQGRKIELEFNARFSDFLTSSHTF